MISGFDLLPTEPSLLPFFVALCDTISGLGKAYKKRSGLCRRPRADVVFLPSKKGNGGGSGSRSKPFIVKFQTPLEAEQNIKYQFQYKRT